MIALVICILVTIGLGTIISMIIEAANEILDYIATSIRSIPRPPSPCEAWRRIRSVCIIKRNVYVINIQLVLFVAFRSLIR